MVILGVGMADRKIGQHAYAQLTRAPRSLSAITLKPCPGSA
jgi:hypothetical protein